MKFTSISKVILSISILFGIVTTSIGQSNSNSQPLKTYLKQLEVSHKISFIYENGLLDSLNITDIHDSIAPLDLQLKIPFQNFKLEYKKISHNT